MATPYHVQLGPNDTGILKYNHSDEEATKVSQLLQKDLEVGLNPKLSNLSV